MIKKEREKETNNELKSVERCSTLFLTFDYQKLVHIEQEEIHINTCSLTSNTFCIEAKRIV